MATETPDPETEKSTPHATTADQIAEMESEGQAQTHEAAAKTGDQDIDTAGTEADEESVVNATNQHSKDRQLEIPGDTDSADIVGPTGEQMPRQRHEGVKD